MANLLKTLLFLAVVVGTAAYLFVQVPQMGEWWSSVTSGLSGVFSPGFSEKKNNETPDHEIAGFTEDQISPYSGRAKIFYDASTGAMGVDFSFSEPVNITGWQIQTNRGETIIPLVVNDWDVLNSPNLKAISILSGRVKIFPGQSASNRNFRLNVCLGFLNNERHFTPTFNNNCSFPERSDYLSLSGYCQNYILSLASCETADRGFINTLAFDSQGLACRNFLETINYYGCVNNLKDKTGFYLNEWWIWNNQNIVDPEHDWIRLFDNKGLVVDSLIY